MKIYTKTGDQGETSLLGGTRVSKSDLRIEAYGTVDELNSWIGTLRASVSENFKTRLEGIQNNLFSIGSLLASESKENKFNLPEITKSDIEDLELAIDGYNKDLPELRNFILPGGSLETSYAHLARCVCRRAERRVVALKDLDESGFSPLILLYLNRLSDYLFVFSRVLSKELNVKELHWNA